MNTTLRLSTLCLTIIAILACGGCTHTHTAGAAPQALASATPPATMATESSVAAGTTGGGQIPAEQLLLVVAEGEETSRGRLYRLERGNNGWQIAGVSVAAMLGRNGFAKPGEKREGDGHTPSGLFPLEFVFGYAPSVATSMPYRQATENDVWVDDVQSPDYNSWRKKGETTAHSFEQMRLPDHLYRHGVVIGYNRQPVVKGKGSAIFLHVWREDGQTTAGCVAIDEGELVRIIGWLDPARRPMILMGNRADLAAIPGFPGLPRQDRPGELPAMERQVRAKAADLRERLVEYGSAEGFFGMALPLPKAVLERIRLRESRHEPLSVPAGELSYLVLGYWDPEGRPRVGELLVPKKLALKSIKAFSDLYAARHRIETLKPIVR